MVANAEFEEQAGCGWISRLYTQALLLRFVLSEVCLEGVEGVRRVQSEVSVIS